MNVILLALGVLGVLGAIGSLVLYFVSKKFYVYEDPRVGQVEEVLPGANCGGCGFPGCHGMADACVKEVDASKSLGSLLCPVGGADCMAKVAGILGVEAGAAEPKLAVVRCNGNLECRPKLSIYDGVKSCAVAASTFAGETGCAFGCLGLGDCVRACTFDAIHINPVTGLPEVDEEKCVACGACAKACPKLVIEIRKKNAAKTPAIKRVWVSCINKDKGAVARKACSSACIGCGKCEKTCKFGAITIANNLAYIDSEKCKACGMCVAECPTGAIHCTAAVQTIVEKLKAKKAADAAKAKEEALKKAAEAAAKAAETAEAAVKKVEDVAAKVADTATKKVEEVATKVADAAAKVVDAATTPKNEQQQ